MEALEKLRTGLSGNSELLGLLDLVSDLLKQKDRTSQDLASVLADKDAELARLRSEVGRLRRAVSSLDTLHDTHASEVKALQAQLQQITAESKAAERSAVLASAVPSAGSLQGEVHKLQALADAKSALVARLEADLAAQAAAAAARVEELQNSFANKVADMRRSHTEQLAAARAEAAAAASKQADSSGPQAQLSALRAQVSQQAGELESLRAQLGAQQAAVSGLSSELAEAAAARDTEARKAAAAAAARREVEDKLKAAEARVADAEAKAAAAKAGGASAGGGAGAAGSQQGAETVAMLNMMEGQLARLSEMIRVRDAEISDLRAAVISGSEERRELSQQLAALQAQGQGGEGGRGGGGGGGPSSPSGQSSGGHALPSPGRAPGAHASPNKPYRTGLVSKPKFK